MKLGRKFRLASSYQAAKEWLHEEFSTKEVFLPRIFLNDYKESDTNTRTLANFCWGSERNTMQWSALDCPALDGRPTHGLLFLPA